MEEFLEAVFSVQATPRLYNENQWVELPVMSPWQESEVEVGSQVLSRQVATESSEHYFLWSSRR
jgi:hypothetical protein